MKKKYASNWRQIKPTEALNVNALKEYLTKIFEDRQVNKPWTGITYHTGFEEDGTEYEYWMVNGTMMGRGAYEYFCKALQEQAKSILVADEYYTKN